jgi:hypothetical protein
LALLFNNQGLVRQEFRAGLGLIRSVESTLTAIAYYHLGLFTIQSLEIVHTIIPGVLIGIPLGAYVIRRLDAETFRRMCMSFDAWIVGFGLSRVLVELQFAAGVVAYGPLLLAVLLDAYLLYLFFKARRPGRDQQPRAEGPRAVGAMLGSLSRLPGK